VAMACAAGQSCRSFPRPKPQARNCRRMSWSCLEAGREQPAQCDP
jgi:hypothetical protein